MSESASFREDVIQAADYSLAVLVDLRNPPHTRI